MRQRMDSLQVIRTLAFLGIFASHSGITAFNSGGAWGVSVFLILSGFLMTYSYLGTERITDKSIKSSFRFGVGKIKKLYPLHIVTMLLAVPFLIYEYRSHAGLGKIITPAVKLVLNVALVQSWIPKSGFYFSLNAVSWYLSTSLFLYMTFPFILFGMKRYKKGIKTAIIIISVTYIIQILLAFLAYVVNINLIHDDDFIHWFPYIFPLSRLEDFIIGCNLGYIFMNHRNEEKGSDQKVYTIAEIGVVAIIIVQWILYLTKIYIPSKADPPVPTSNWWGLTVLWTMSSCALVYLFALKRGKLSQLLSNKALIFIGNMSANGFLIHQMVYRYLNSFEKKLFGQSNNYINLLICFAITMASAYLWDKTINRFHKKKETPNDNLKIMTHSS